MVASGRVNSIINALVRWNALAWSDDIDRCAFPGCLFAMRLFVARAVGDKKSERPQEAGATAFGTERIQTYHERAPPYAATLDEHGARAALR